MLIHDHLCHVSSDFLHMIKSIFYTDVSHIRGGFCLFVWSLLFFFFGGCFFFFGGGGGHMHGWPTHKISLIKKIIFFLYDCNRYASFYTYNVWSRYFTYIRTYEI